MRLTPPTIPVFLLAIVLASLGIGDLYVHIPHAHSFIAAHRFGIMVVAFCVMTAGVLLPGL